MNSRLLRRSNESAPPSFRSSRATCTAATIVMSAIPPRIPASMPARAALIGSATSVRIETPIVLGNTSVRAISAHDSRVASAGSGPGGSCRRPRRSTARMLETKMAPTDHPRSVVSEAAPTSSAATYPTADSPALTSASTRTRSASGTTLMTAEHIRTGRA